MTTWAQHLTTWPQTSLPLPPLQALPAEVTPGGALIIPMDVSSDFATLEALEQRSYHEVCLSLFALDLDDAEAIARFVREFGPMGLHATVPVVQPWPSGIEPFSATPGFRREY